MTDIIAQCKSSASPSSNSALSTQGLYPEWKHWPLNLIICYHSQNALQQNAQELF